jgi:hypothetical protein
VPLSLPATSNPSQDAYFVVESHGSSWVGWWIKLHQLIVISSSSHHKMFHRIGACTIKHFGFVIYGEMDRFCNMLVSLLLSVTFTDLDKHTSLLYNLCITNL